MRLIGILQLVASAAAAARGVHEPATRGTAVDIPLQVFQVQAPLRDSYDGAACSQTIVQHNFAASYGSPYIGSYNPPSNCNWTTAIFNMTITSAGINYDRLTLLYFNDTEVWRSTTAMPVRTGIYYTFSKDMTVYSPLLTQTQKVIMQLDNIYDAVFTGNFNVTVTALYYNDAKGNSDNSTINPPDRILPISSLSSGDNKTSAFSLPGDNASVTLAFPRNVERAVVSVFASGNGNEEFWYTDVPAQFTRTFGNSSFANGYGPWREIQVLIDGALAGAVWPFPVVFTGGVNPALWVPIVGVDAYDLGSVDVDVSPWLGILCDGGEHVFELKVVGYDAASPDGSGGVASNWFVSGEVFLWLDEGGNQTTGGTLDSSPHDLAFDLRSELTTFPNGTNSSLWVGLKATRGIQHTSAITTSKGTRNLSWSQTLLYENYQNITASGRTETLWQNTSGSAAASAAREDDDGGGGLAELGFAYPISFYQAYAIPSDYEATNSTLNATIDRSKTERGRGALSALTYPADENAHPDSLYYALETRQNGTAFEMWNNTYYEGAGAIDPAEGSDGATDQWFSWRGSVGTAAGRRTRAYGRFVSALDGYAPGLTADESVDGEMEVPPTSPVEGAGIPPVCAVDAVYCYGRGVVVGNSTSVSALELVRV